MDSSEKLVAQDALFFFFPEEKRAVLAVEVNQGWWAGRPSGGSLHDLLAPNFNFYSKPDFYGAVQFWFGKLFST